MKKLDIYYMIISAWLNIINPQKIVLVGVKPLVRSYKQASYIPQGKGIGIASGKVAYTCIVNKNIKIYFQSLLISKLYHDYLLY